MSEPKSNSPLNEVFAGLGGIGYISTAARDVCLAGEIFNNATTAGLPHEQAVDLAREAVRDCYRDYMDVNPAAAWRGFTDRAMAEKAEQTVVPFAELNQAVA